jgi:hypothetical protein
MNKMLRNKVNMFRATDKVLDESKEQLAELPDFPEHHMLFQGNLKRIDGLDSKLESDTSGTTEDKEDLVDFLAGEAYKASIKLKALARKEGDKKLFAAL